MFQPFEKILVTGAGGFIGSRLVPYLRNKSGAQVTALKRSSCDLTNQSDVSMMFSEHSPDCIFHLAAVGVSHARSNDSAVVDENLVMMKNMAKQLNDQTTMIIAGSMAEYGGAGVFGENDACSPETEYGKAKLAVTELAAELVGSSHPRICVARLFGVYGPGEASYRLFPGLIDGLLQDRTVELSDGMQRRDFIHVDDVCKVFWKLACCEQLPPLVNVGTGTAIRLKEICEWIADGLGKSRKLLGFGMRHRSPGDADLIAADVSLLSQLTGKTPPQRLCSDSNLTELFEINR